MSDKNEAIRLFIRILGLIRANMTRIQAELARRPGIREVMFDVDPTNFVSKDWRSDLSKGEESFCLYLDVDTEKQLPGGQSGLWFHFCLEWSGAQWVAGWTLGWGGGNSPWLQVEEAELRAASIHEIADGMPDLTEGMTDLFWRTLDEHLQDQAGSE